jgi:putative hydrolase of the HAD superfamily
MTAPTAILFDFGGTLDADGIQWKDRFRAMTGHSGNAEAFDRAFYAADDALVGTIPRDLPFRDTVELLARNLVRELGMDAGRGPQIADVFFRDSLEKAQASARILGHLTRRFRLGIVSNFYGNLEAVCADTGIARHVQVAVDSAVVGFEKPDPRIFRAALSALDVKPEEAVFVGDSLPRDMNGARDLGMPHIYVAPGGEKACCPQDRVIGTVAQLLEMYP